MHLPPLRLERTSGFNHGYQHGGFDIGQYLPIIDGPSKFQSELEQEKLEKEFDATFNTAENVAQQDKYCCQICYLGYDLGKLRPLSLTCGHTVCATCAKSLYKNQLIQCPFDKKCYQYDCMKEMG